jgi:hypothetical protein
VGTNLFFNGNIGPYQPLNGIFLNNPFPKNVVLTYNAGAQMLTEQITDTITRVTQVLVYYVNLSALFGGSTAYVGFTGADGAATSTQQISNFAFIYSSPITISSGGSQTPIGVLQIPPGNVTPPASGAVQPNVSIAGFGDGTGWKVNSNNISSTPIANDVLTLTDNGSVEARSAFYTTAVPTTGNFTASFTYTASALDFTNAADGVAFVLQNSPAGASALGGVGGALGYGGLPGASLAVALNIYAHSPKGVGVNLFTNGSIGSYIPLNGITLNNPDPKNIVLSYDASAQTLTEQITDTITGVTQVLVYHVDLSVLFGGSTAYVGFTGADGGITSIQQISNFTFRTSSLPSLGVGGGSGLPLPGGRSPGPNQGPITDATKASYVAQSALTLVHPEIPLAIFADLGRINAGLENGIVVREIALMGGAAATVTTGVVITIKAAGEGAPEAAARQESRVELVFTADAQLERLDLPTERDILASMDVAASLRATNRPQANLVPDQQESVIAVGALMPADTEARPVRKVDGASAGVQKFDLRPFLMSPVEDTVLGPASHPANGLPALEPVGNSPEGDRPAMLVPGRWWEEAMTVALALALVRNAGQFASSRSSRERCGN